MKVWLVVLVAAFATCDRVRDWGAGRIHVSQECLDNPLARSCMP